MANVLVVKVNPKKTEESYSLRLAEAFVNEYKKQHPNDEIIELDLYKVGVPFIDAEVFNGWGKFAAQQELTKAEQEKVQRISDLTDQFLAADKVVFAAPLWNFGYPPYMKAYIDSIAIAGKTFKYTENGPVGLAGNKPVVLLESRGGIYSEGPMKAMQFTESYLRTVMQFVGIENFTSVVVEGVNQNPEKAEEIYKDAERKAIDIAHTF